MEIQESVVDKVSAKILESLDGIVRSILEEANDANKEAILTEIRTVIDEKLKTLDSRIVTVENSLKTTAEANQAGVVETKPEVKSVVASAPAPDMAAVITELKGVIAQSFENFSKTLVVASADRKSVDAGSTDTKVEKVAYADLPEEKKVPIRRAFYEGLLRGVRRQEDEDKD
jgi:hypothetical protein